MGWPPWQKPMELTMSSATPEYCKLCGGELDGTRVAVSGRLYHPTCIPDAGGWKQKGIEAAYNCILREAIVMDQGELVALLEKYNTEAEMIERIAELEACIREMQKSIPGGQIASCQEMADDLRAIALRHGVRMGDEQ